LPRPFGRSQVRCAAGRPAPCSAATMAGQHRAVGRASSRGGNAASGAGLQARYPAPRAGIAPPGCLRSAGLRPTTAGPVPPCAGLRPVPRPRAGPASPGRRPEPSAGSSRGGCAGRAAGPTPRAPELRPVDANSASPFPGPRSAAASMRPGSPPSRAR
jgi:hypothetical protein